MVKDRCSASAQINKNAREAAGGAGYRCATGAGEGSQQLCA